MSGVICSATSIPRVDIESYNVLVIEVLPGPVWGASAVLELWWYLQALFSWASASITRSHPLVWFWDPTIFWVICFPVWKYIFERFFPSLLVWWTWLVKFQILSTINCSLYTMNSGPVILSKSQPAKNRNLSRIISNLSRLKTKNPVLVYPVIFPV